MIAIIKYNAGNIKSVENALWRLGQPSVITNDIDEIREADKVILPGVGEASSAMKSLKKSGLDLVIPTLTQPLLGICLGLQLMCRHSEEGNTVCMDIFNTNVRKFEPLDIVPHMGWNNFTKLENGIFDDLQLEDDVYFVHSYYAQVCQYTVATCEYINPFSAALQKDNFYATQFHPEKSAVIGERILKKFTEL